ncbi:hypothetical protein GWI33_003549 [Rhynchophorus ferrugineus]|uniref:Uncharacterized protein n=1 Tax=Rhynchophorus ferrugineus TaxID=354439 RepID=A0A834M137_RHYFE|nr:hypothetical protein GWI33_003549 [Rhynchophorus ferrugineus]
MMCGCVRVARQTRRIAIIRFPFRDDLSDERPTGGPLFPFRRRKEHIFSPSRIHAGLGVESTYPLSGIIDGESGERH